MKISDIKYTPNPLPAVREAGDDLMRFSRLAAEFGHSAEAATIMADTLAGLEAAKEKLAKLSEVPQTDTAEPEDLAAIRASRPSGARRLVQKVPSDYPLRFRGSILGRSAGCTLGAALEFQSMEQMRSWAEYFDEEFPPTDYFQRIKEPGRPRYIVGKIDDTTRGKISFVPADDDTAYTMIGLLVLEHHGQGFTKEQQAEVWRRNFTLTSKENGSWGAYWGERKFLENLDAGLPPATAGYRNNPNVQSIAAWTRADAWAYAAPGWPEKAAELAFKDASINHRRNGVYGSMFMAAAISAAFVVDDPMEALNIALQEIPKESLLAEGIRWALELGPSLKNYHDAGMAVRERYADMFEGHAVNNAIFVALGIAIAGKEFTRVIGETMAMGFDNDCTAATAGSIVGAIIGEKSISRHWTEPFQNRMQVYLKELPPFVTFDELGARFKKQAEAIHDNKAK